MNRNERLEQRISLLILGMFMMLAMISVMGSKSYALVPIFFDGYEVPDGRCGAKIEGVKLDSYIERNDPAGASARANNFKKTSGPSWINIDKGGAITGTRPDTESEATTVVVEVTFDDGEKGTFEIPVGAVYKEVISEVRANSNYAEPTFGGTISRLDFTVTSGSPAHFQVSMSGWQGESSTSMLTAGLFGAEKYYYTIQLRIDDAGYKFSDDLKVYINDNEWTVSDFCMVQPTYSYTWVDSPETTLVEPEEIPFSVNAPSYFYIESGKSLSVIDPTLKLSFCAVGGKKPYTYTKLSGPDWIQISDDGVISGTRPNGNFAATDLVVEIFDSEGANGSVTIPVGRIYDPSLRTEITEIRATSTYEAPCFGATITSPEFSFTTGTSADITIGGHFWMSGTENFYSGTFDKKEYYYQMQIRLDNESGYLYKFSNNLKVYVNGEEWIVGFANDVEYYSYIWIESPHAYAGEDISSKEATLSQDTFTYDGKEKKPSVTVSGLTLGRDYTVTYKNNINAGTATVVIEGIGEYFGTITKHFTIIPMATAISSLENASDGITVKWTRNASATGYDIYRSVNGAAYKKVKTITSGSTVSWKDKGAKKNGTKYQYKIGTFASIGATTYTAADSGVKTTYFVSKPKISKLTKSGAKITVKWAKNDKASGYQVQYGLKSNFSGAKSVSIAKNKTVSKTISKLKKGKTYYVRIRTFKTVKGKKYYSDWSSKKTVKIK